MRAAHTGSSLEVYAPRIPDFTNHFIPQMNVTAIGRPQGGSRRVDMSKTIGLEARVLSQPTNWGTGTCRAASKL